MNNINEAINQILDGQNIQEVIKKICSVTNKIDLDAINDIKQINEELLQDLSKEAAAKEFNIPVSNIINLEVQEVISNFKNLCIIKPCVGQRQRLSGSKAENVAIRRIIRSNILTAGTEKAAYFPYPYRNSRKKHRI